MCGRSSKDRRNDQGGKKNGTQDGRHNYREPKRVGKVEKKMFEVEEPGGFDEEKCPDPKTPRQPAQQRRNGKTTCPFRLLFKYRARVHSIPGLVAGAARLPQHSAERRVNSFLSPFSEPEPVLTSANH